MDVALPRVSSVFWEERTWHPFRRAQCSTMPSIFWNIYVSFLRVWHVPAAAKPRIRPASMWIIESMNQHLCSAGQTQAAAAVSLGKPLWPPRHTLPPANWLSVNYLQEDAAELRAAAIDRLGDKLRITGSFYQTHENWCGPFQKSAYEKRAHEPTLRQNLN